MRTAYIAIRSEKDAARNLLSGFRNAWKSGTYQGEHFEFASPAALFRAISPKRWELIEALQATGAMGVRELARHLKRDVRRVHDDAKALLQTGLIEKTPDGKLIVPFAEIHADFVLKSAA